MKSKIFSMLVSIISFCVLVFHQCTKEDSDYSKYSASYSLKIDNEYDRDLIPFLTKKGLYGYFSRTLNKLVVPAHYKEAGFFKNGYAEAKTAEGEKVSISCNFGYEVQLPTVDSIINNKQITKLKENDKAETRVLLNREASEGFDKLISKLDIGKNEDRNLYFYPNIKMLVLEVGNSFYIKSKDSTEFSKQRFTDVRDFFDGLSITTIENTTTGEESFFLLEADGRKPIYTINEDGQQFYHVSGRTYLNYHERKSPCIVKYDGLLLKQVFFDRCMSFEDAYNLALAESYFVQHIELPKRWSIKKLSYLGANYWALSYDKALYSIYDNSNKKLEVSVMNPHNPFSGAKLSLSGGVTLMKDIEKGKLAFCTRKGSKSQLIYYKDVIVIPSHRCLCVEEISNEKNSHFYIDEFGLIYDESRLQIPLTKARGVKFSVDSDDEGLIHCFNYGASRNSRSYKYLEETKRRDEDVRMRRTAQSCTIL